MGPFLLRLCVRPSAPCMVLHMTAACACFMVRGSQRQFCQFGLSQLCLRWRGTLAQRVSIKPHRPVDHQLHTPWFNGKRERKTHVWSLIGRWIKKCMFSFCYPSGMQTGMIHIFFDLSFIVSSSNTLMLKCLGFVQSKLILSISANVCSIIVSPRSVCFSPSALKAAQPTHYVTRYKNPVIPGEDLHACQE